MKIKLTELTERAMSALRQINLTEGTLKYCKYCFRQVQAYCESRGLDFLDERLAKAYINTSQNSRYQK